MKPTLTLHNNQAGSFMVEMLMGISLLAVVSVVVSQHFFQNIRHRNTLQAYTNVINETHQTINLLVYQNIMPTLVASGCNYSSSTVDLGLNSSKAQIGIAGNSSIASAYSPRSASVCGSGSTRFNAGRDEMETCIRISNPMAFEKNKLSKTTTKDITVYLRLNWKLARNGAAASCQAALSNFNALSRYQLGPIMTSVYYEIYWRGTKVGAQSMAEEEPHMAKMSYILGTGN